MSKLLRFYNPHVDGLVSHCEVCKKHPVKFDYGITDDLWNEVVPEELQPYVICLDCFEDMSDGIPKKDWLILYYTGKAGTVAFIPVHLIREGDAGNE
jgi:hypothetical protein